MFGAVAGHIGNGHLLAMNMDTMLLSAAAAASATTSPPDTKRRRARHVAIAVSFFIVVDRF